MSTPQPASPSIVRQHAALLDHLPFSDTQDFDDVARGLIARSTARVRDAAGTVVWDNSTYDFLTGDARTRSTRACGGSRSWSRSSGLFEVVPGIYQVRGMDLSNISFIEGDDRAWSSSTR